MPRNPAEIFDLAATLFFGSLGALCLGVAIFLKIAPGDRGLCVILAALCFALVFLSL
jgi:hypothetical protein